MILLDDFNKQQTLNKYGLLRKSLFMAYICCCWVETQNMFLRSSDFTWLPHRHQRPASFLCSCATSVLGSHVTVQASPMFFHLKIGGQRWKSHSPLLRTRLGSYVYSFFSYPIGCDSITLPHVAVRESDQYSLTPIIALRGKTKFRIV